MLRRPEAVFGLTTSLMLLLTATPSAAQDGASDDAAGFAVEYRALEDAEMAEYLRDTCHNKLQQAEAELAEVLAKFDYTLELSITGVSDPLLSGTTCSMTATRTVAIDLK